MEGYVHTPKFQKGYSTSRYSQFLVLLSRAFKQQWRCPKYQFAVMVICVFISLLSGWPYVSYDLDTETNLRSLISMVFFSVTILCNLSFQTSIPFYFGERIVFYREQASQMYAPLPWGIAYILSEFPFITMTTLVYVIIFYVSTTELLLLCFCDFDS